jgi:hypothetical protein
MKETNHRIQIQKIHSKSKFHEQSNWWNHAIKEKEPGDTLAEAKPKMSLVRNAYTFAQQVFFWKKKTNKQRIF